MTPDRFKISVERTRPRRGVTNAYRKAETAPDTSTSARRKAKSRGLLTSSEDVVLEAVKLGYKIADEQIARGQEWARDLRNASLGANGGDVGTLVDEALRLARQFAVMLVEVGETTIQAPAIAKEWAKQVNEGDQPSKAKSSAKPAGGSYSVPVQVRSRQLTRVTVKLDEKPTSEPEVYPLYLKDGKDAEPLRDVSFRDLGAEGYCLSVCIPDDTPAGLYRGYAVGSDGSPVGTIRVQVGADEHDEPAAAQQRGERS